MNNTQYESNTRTNKRKIILEKAKDLFIRDGIHNISMRQIASESDISIRSLYEYYKSKEVMAIDIQIQVMKEVMGSVDGLPETSNGYEQVSVIVKGMLDVLLDHKKQVKYITAFDFYFYNGYPTDKYVNYIQSLPHNILEEAFIRGEKDGTVNLHGYDKEIVGDTLLHGLFALAQKNIYRAKSFKEANRETRNGDLHVFVDLLLHSIKGKVD